MGLVVMFVANLVNVKVSRLECFSTCHNCCKHIVPNIRYCRYSIRINPIRFKCLQCQMQNLSQKVNTKPNYKEKLNGLLASCETVS